VVAEDFVMEKRRQHIYDVQCKWYNTTWFPLLWHFSQ